MRSPSFTRLPTGLVLITLLAAVPTLHANLFVVSKGSLSAPAVAPNTIVHFDEIALDSDINGQTIKGFTFSENTPAALASNFGPGDTNNVTVPWASNVSIIDPSTYVLTINMPAVVTRFGFGFAINTPVSTANAITVALFDGATNLGSLTFGGVPDPLFDGGFAGVGSTVGFDRVQVTFGIASNGFFAIDNVAAVVPEPGTLLAGLLVAGVCAFVSFPRRCRA